MIYCVQFGFGFGGFLLKKDYRNGEENPFTEGPYSWQQKHRFNSPIVLSLFYRHTRLPHSRLRRSVQLGDDMFLVMGDND
jgi:hypothetical protein